MAMESNRNVEGKPQTNDRPRRDDGVGMVLNPAFEGVVDTQAPGTSSSNEKNGVDEGSLESLRAITSRLENRLNIPGYSLVDYSVKKNWDTSAPPLQRRILTCLIAPLSPLLENFEVLLPVFPLTQRLA